MGASPHLRWVAVVAAASLAAAVPAGAQEPASPDAAPSGSSAPRPDPAPVKTKPRVVVRAAPRPAAPVTTTTAVTPSAPATTTTTAKPRASKPARRATTHRATAHHRKAVRRTKPAAHVALPRLPHLTLAQLSAPVEHRRRRPRAQARRRRAVAADPRAGERDAPGLHRARRAQAGGAVRRALLLAVVGLAVWATSAAALRPVITPTVTGQTGDNGWYVTNVIVNWTHHAAGYLVDSGCAPSTLITSDTTGHEASSARPSNSDGDDGLRRASRSIATPRVPSVTANADRRCRRRRLLQPPAHGHAGPASTPTSGIASCTSTPYSGPDGTGISLTGTCKDKAGNVSAPVPFVFNYDATPPALAAVTATPGRRRRAARVAGGRGGEGDGHAQPGRRARGAGRRRLRRHRRPGSPTPG